MSADKIVCGVSYVRRPVGERYLMGVLAEKYNAVMVVNIIDHCGGYRNHFEVESTEDRDRLLTALYERDLL